MVNLQQWNLWQLDMQIIILFVVQWTLLCFTYSALVGTKFPLLVIEPISSREYGQYVVKKVQDTLNLTCTVFDNSTDMEPRYNVTWSIPSSSSNSKNRVVIQSSMNSVNLVVPHLETRDGGEYSCNAQPINRDHESLTSVVIVNIKSRRKICGETMFTCSLSQIQTCIPRRYQCDGYPDCQMGEDEDQDVCGESPCINKLECEDHLAAVMRCIPKSWCCSVIMDDNCTTREPLACCPNTIHKSYMDDRNYFASHQPHFNETLLQTTIYTIIGCAMVFMIVVTVLVIAICRLHMKRSLITQCPANVTHSHQSSQPHQNTPLYDSDVYLNRGCTLENLPAPGLLVTYNINNGVQIVGHGVDPPPYCEVISVPPREGPPPPYTSQEALDQPEIEALLQQPNISQSVRIEDQQLRRTGGDQYE